MRKGITTVYAGLAMLIATLVLVQFFLAGLGIFGAFTIFDFKLVDEEMREIRKLANPRGRVVNWGGSPEWD